MTLFELQDGRLSAASGGRPVGGDARLQVLTAVRSQLGEVLRRPLLPVVWTGVEGGQSLTSLDPAGQVVTVEVLAVLDATALVSAFSRQADASAMGRGELGDVYPGGAQAFRNDWEEFREAAPARVEPGPRLIVLTTELAADVRLSATFLGGSVEVHVVDARVIRDASGRESILVSVDLVRADPFSSPPTAPSGRASRRSSDTRSTHTQSHAATHTAPMEARPTTSAPSHAASYTAPMEARPTTSAPSHAASHAAAPAPAPARAAWEQERTTPRSESRTAAREENRTENRAASPTENRTENRAASRTENRTENRAASRTESRTESRVEMRAAARAASRAEGRGPAAEPPTMSMPRPAAAPPPSATPSPYRAAAPSPAPEPPVTRSAVRAGASAAQREPVAPPPTAVADSTRVSTMRLSTGSFRSPSEQERTSTYRRPAPAPELSPNTGSHRSLAPILGAQPTVSADEAPAVLAALARTLSTPATLRWFSVRRGIDHTALLTHDGVIVLADGRTFTDPSMAAAAAQRAQDVDGWRVWRLGERGATLAELLS